MAATQDRIDYTRSRQWTNWLQPNPIAIVQNLLGGGDVQRAEVAIADLEVKSGSLEAQKAELQRQIEEEKQRLQETVLSLVLEYEEAGREVEQVRSQLEAFEISRRVYRVRYRFGGGSTAELLAMESKKERLHRQRTNGELQGATLLRELVQLTGFDVETKTNLENETIF